MARLPTTPWPLALVVAVLLTLHAAADAQQQQQQQRRRNSGLPPSPPPSGSFQPPYTMRMVVTMSEVATTRGVGADPEPDPVTRGMPSALENAIVYPIDMAVGRVRSDAAGGAEIDAGTVRVDLAYLRDKFLQVQERDAVEEAAGFPSEVTFFVTCEDPASPQARVLLPGRDACTVLGPPSVSAGASAPETQQAEAEIPELFRVWASGAFPEQEYFATLICSRQTPLATWENYCEDWTAVEGEPPGGDGEVRVGSGCQMVGRAEASNEGLTNITMTGQSTHMRMRTSASPALQDVMPAEVNMTERTTLEIAIDVAAVPLPGSPLPLEPSKGFDEAPPNATMPFGRRLAQAGGEEEGLGGPEDPFAVIIESTTVAHFAFEDLRLLRAAEMRERLDVC